MKFVEGGGRLSLGAVAGHLDKYPDFIEQGGVYQIPRDFYETVKMLYEMPADKAKYLTKSGDGPSPKDWKLVHDFFDTHGIDIDDLEPSKLDYADAQKDAIGGKMESERGKLLEEDKKIRRGLYEKSRPTMREGAKAAAVGAALEGATTFAVSVRSRLGDGRRMRDITADEWAEIAKETGLGLGKGGVRGAAVYGLNNFTATPASVASALVTASFGVADCAHKYRCGELGELEFIERSEMACLDASVSALASFIGQAAIPVPVLGALIGNAVGMTAYELGKDFYNKGELEAAERGAKELRDLDAWLDAEYEGCLTRTREGMAAYVTLLKSAFSPDVRVAFDGSVALALRTGVAAGEVLASEQDVDDYFLG